MSVVKDALEALREAAKLVDEVKLASTQISDLAGEVRDIDRRVARLEGKWEAAMEIAGRCSQRALAKPEKPDSDK